MKTIEKMDKSMREALGDALSKFEDTPENRLALAAVHLSRALELYDEVFGPTKTAEMLDAAANERRAQ